MVIKVFVLGLPGSGKSTVSKHIVNYLRQKHINRVAKHISDYDILLRKRDISGERFYSKGEFKDKGFIVKDSSVYDEALKEAESTVSMFPITVEFAVVEFVRKSYEDAFNLFARSFVVENSYFLFLDTDVATCKRRIYERVTHWKSTDDHYVPSLVFRLYDVRRNKFYIKAGLKAKFGIGDSRVKIIRNKGELKDILLDIEEFVDFILTCEGISQLSLTGHKLTNK